MARSSGNEWKCKDKWLFTQDQPFTQEYNRQSGCGFEMLIITVGSWYTYTFIKRFFYFIVTLVCAIVCNLKVEVWDFYWTQARGPLWSRSTTIFSFYLYKWWIDTQSVLHPRGLVLGLYLYSLIVCSPFTCVSTGWCIFMCQRWNSLYVWCVLVMSIKTKILIDHDRSIDRLSVQSIYHDRSLAKWSIIGSL